MDNSETYIKMRLAAIPDLGRGYPPKYIGGYDTDPEFITNNVFVDAKGDFYQATSIQHCQLERQDQLQEMSGLTWHDFDLLCWVVVREKLEKKKMDYPSKEMASLMAYMYHNHNKEWDGEKWVRTGS